MHCPDRWSWVYLGRGAGEHGRLQTTALAGLRFLTDGAALAGPGDALELHRVHVRPDTRLGL